MVGTFFEIHHSIYCLLKSKSSFNEDGLRLHLLLLRFKSKVIADRFKWSPLLLGMASDPLENEWYNEYQVLQACFTVIEDSPGAHHKLFRLLRQIHAGDLHLVEQVFFNCDEQAQNLQQIRSQSLEPGILHIIWLTE